MALVAKFKPVTDHAEIFTLLKMDDAEKTFAAYALDDLKMTVALREDGIVVLDHKLEIAKHLTFPKTMAIKTKTGEVSKYTLALIRTQLMEALIVLCNKKHGDAMPSSAMSMLKAKSAAPDNIYPIDQITTGVRVQLQNATKLYQPVFGSVETSRYFAVAIGDLNMGIRIKPLGKSISIRVEGKAFKSYVSQLGNLGFNVSNNYASVHLGTGDMLTVNKVVGALIMGLPTPVTTPFPDLSLLEGKGA